MSIITQYTELFQKRRRTPGAGHTVVLSLSSVLPAPGQVRVRGAVVQVRTLGQRGPRSTGSHGSPGADLPLAQMPRARAHLQRISQTPVHRVRAPASQPGGPAWGASPRASRSASVLKDFSVGRGRVGGPERLPWRGHHLAVGRYLRGWGCRKKQHTFAWYSAPWGANVCPSPPQHLQNCGVLPGPFGVCAHQGGSEPQSRLRQSPRQGLREGTHARSKDVTGTQMLLAEAKEVPHFLQFSRS